MAKCWSDGSSNNRPTYVEIKCSVLDMCPCIYVFSLLCFFLLSSFHSYSFFSYLAFPSLISVLVCFNFLLSYFIIPSVQFSRMQFIFVVDIRHQNPLLSTNACALMHSCLQVLKELKSYFISNRIKTLLMGGSQEVVLRNRTVHQINKHFSCSPTMNHIAHPEEK